MSRSGYIDDGWSWGLICWRGAVKRALYGNRGQEFLREMLVALDNLSKKTLISGELVDGDKVCAIGAVGKARGMPMTDIDPEDNDRIADVFGIARAMACEIMWVNDEQNYEPETPEQRFTRVHSWVTEQLVPLEVPRDFNPNG